MLFFAEGWLSWTSRAAQLQSVEAASDNLAQSLKREAEGSIATTDAALVGLIELLEMDGTGPSALARVERLLAIQSAHRPDLRGFSVDASDGRRLVSSVPNLPRGANNADRAYFRHHRDDPGRGLFVGPAVRSQLSGNWVITFSRRFDGPDGQFGGVAVASMEAAEVARRYSVFDVGRQGSIALVHADGTILARHPFDDDAVGKIAPGALSPQGVQDPVGRYRYLSPIDGAERLASYRRSDRFPIIMIVARSTDEALGAWLRDTRIEMAAVIGVAAVIGALGLRLIAQVSRRRKTDLELIRSEAQFRILAEHASDMVSRVDAEGVRRYASPAAERLFGVPATKLTGLRPVDSIHPDDKLEFESLITSLRDGQEQGGLSYRIRRPDGAEVWIESTVRGVRNPRTGAPDGYVGVSRDVTIARAMEAKLEALATTDGLTNIANRRRFDESLFTEWRRAARDKYSLAVLLLDVDHFKGFNDRYGHLAGDDCLRAVARVVSETIRRPADMAARYGGEEFAVILPATDMAGAADVAEHVRAAIEAAAIPYGASEAGVVTVSIGVAAVLPQPRTALETSTLVGAADGALYEAKRSGRNRVASALPDPALAPHH